MQTQQHLVCVINICLPKTVKYWVGVQQVQSYLMERKCLISCETNLDGLNDFSNFSGRGYLPLIEKDSTTHMHGQAVYLKEWLPFAWDLSLETSADTCLCFQLALLHSMSYFFFLYQSVSSSLCIVFYSSSSNIDEFLSISPYITAFVFKEFNIHHKDQLTYFGGTDGPGELCFIFSQTTFLR